MLIIPSEARCPKGILHDYEIAHNYPDALIEICNYCLKKVIYPKREGVYDEKKHLKAHLRDTIQPFGRNHKLFIQVHGTQGIETLQKVGEKFIGKRARDEELQELKEKRRFMRKQAFKGSGKSDKEIDEELNKFKYKTTGQQ